jgi:hypothetical protein
MSGSSRLQALQEKRRHRLALRHGGPNGSLGEGALVGFELRLDVLDRHAGVAPVQ